MSSLSQEVKGYIQRSILEKELLYFGYESFGITFVDPVSITVFWFIYNRAEVF